MATVPTQVRIDENLKKQASELFSQLGMDMSGAMNIFLKQCVLRGGLPFSVELPQYKPEVLEAMEEAKRISKDSNTKRYSSFSDVLEDKWYYKGVCWAFSKGIVSGTDADKFSPDAEITREQLATIIYRYMSGDGTSYDLSSYSDSQSISDYAKDAVAYVSEIGIMSGKGDGRFCPTETATRAEVASMLMRFAEYVKNEAK